MRIIEFTCPRCQERIRAEVEDHETSDEPIRLQCLDQNAPGCGWIGYLPRSRGVVAD